jgi:hypothetical protein
MADTPFISWRMLQTGLRSGIARAQDPEGANAAEPYAQMYRELDEGRRERVDALKRPDGMVPTMAIRLLWQEMKAAGKTPVSLRDTTRNELA